jgi:riboflavin kinase/FMN adenylyltransferase
VANIGLRPTVSDDKQRVLEVHLFDFSADLYDSEIEVAFLSYLRPEKKFENKEALRAQIREDVGTARAWLQNRTAAA